MEKQTEPLKNKRPEDWIGLQFGRLKVIRLIGREGPKNVLVSECICECGNTHRVRVSNLADGTRSCGCLREEINSLPTEERPKRQKKRVLTAEQIEAEKKRKADWVKSNPDKVSQLAARFRAKHPEKIKKEKAAYYQKIKKRQIAKYKLRFKTDLDFRMLETLRSRLRKILRARRAPKADKTMSIAGCTIEFLEAHIKSLFTEGMTWDKFLAGEIHIDHIIPCKSFKNLSDPEEQKKCFGWQNLQPLWAVDNLHKKARLDWTPAESKYHAIALPAKGIPVPSALE